MANKHAVVRTDLMYATDVRSGLVSVKYMGADGSTAADIDNGHVVVIDWLEDDEREVYVGYDVKKGSNTKNVVLIASPEVMYDQREQNLDDYYNEAGKICRGYLLHNDDIFSVTKDALDGKAEPTVGDIVELADGTKLNVPNDGKKATEGAAAIGNIIQIEWVGRYKYYVIQVKLVKNAKATAPIAHYAVPDPDMKKDFGDFGKTSEFLQPDVHVDWDGTTGSVLGTINFVKDNKKFSGDEANGYYYPVVLSDYYKDKTINIHNKDVKDTEIIFCLNNVLKEDKRVVIKCEDELIATLDFNDTTLAAPVNVTIKAQSEEAGYGTKKVSELMDDDVKIAWRGLDGKVTGTFHHITDWSELPKEPHDGHFFVCDIDDRFLGKPFTCTKSNGESTTNPQAGEEEMFWVLRIDENKKFTFKSGEELIANLDFTDATLE